MWIYEYANIQIQLSDPRSIVTPGHWRSSYMRASEMTNCVLFKREHATCGFAWNPQLSNSIFTFRVTGPSAPGKADAAHFSTNGFFEATPKYIFQGVFEHFPLSCLKKF